MIAGSYVTHNHGFALVAVLLLMAVVGIVTATADLQGHLFEVGVPYRF